MYTEEMKTQRMAEDAEMIRDPARWPGDPLHLKTQPWVEPRQFGFIFAGDDKVYHKVLREDGTEVPDPETFPSVDEMVKRWSVD